MAASSSSSSISALSRSNSSQSASTSRRPSQSASSSRRPCKVRSSCDQCGFLKIRCGQGKPACKRCLQHNRQCVYSVSQRMGRCKRVTTEPHSEGGARSTLTKRSTPAKSSAPPSVAGADSPGSSSRHTSPNRGVGDRCGSSSESDMGRHSDFMLDSETGYFGNLDMAPWTDPNVDLNFLLETPPDMSPKPMNGAQVIHGIATPLGSETAHPDSTEMDAFNFHLDMHPSEMLPDDPLFLDNPSSSSEGDGDSDLNRLLENEVQPLSCGHYMSLLAGLAKVEHEISTTTSPQPQQQPNERHESPQPHDYSPGGSSSSSRGGGNGTTQVSVDHVLSLCRSTQARLADMLACGSCSTNTTCVLMSAILSEKLIELYRAGVSAYGTCTRALDAPSGGGRQHRAAHGVAGASSAPSACGALEWHQPPDQSGHTPVCSKSPLRLGAHAVDEGEEVMLVRMLLTSRLKAMTSIMSRLRELAAVLRGEMGQVFLCQSAITNASSRLHAVCSVFNM